MTHGSVETCRSCGQQEGAQAIADEWRETAMRVEEQRTALLAERDAAMAEVERLRGVVMTIERHAIGQIGRWPAYKGLTDPGVLVMIAERARAALKEPSGPHQLAGGQDSRSTPPLMRGADGAESNPGENAQGMVSGTGGGDGGG